MTLAQPKTESMVITVGIICLTVATSTPPMVRRLAPWIRPPANAARNIHTPGVLIQEKVSDPGLSPLNTVTVVANCARKPFTGGTSLEVPSSRMKIKIKHDHALNAERASSSCPAEASI